MYSEIVNDKLLGYSLLVGGIAIMVLSVVQVLLVFTHTIKPISAFQNAKSQVDTSALLQNALNPSGNPSFQMPKLDLIPQDTLNESLNLATHFFLMSFVLGFGYKISSLGVMMLRPITVKLKEQIIP